MKTITNLITNEKKVSANLPGSLELLEEKIKDDGVEIDTGRMMALMPEIVSTLELFQKSVFTAFYWRKMSKYDIKYQYGIRNLYEVDRALNSATNNFIKKLKLKLD